MSKSADFFVSNALHVGLITGHFTKAMDKLGIDGHFDLSHVEESEKRQGMIVSFFDVTDLDNSELGNGSLILDVRQHSRDKGCLSVEISISEGNMGGEIAEPGTKVFKAKYDRKTRSMKPFEKAIKFLTSSVEEDRQQLERLNHPEELVGAS